LIETGQRSPACSQLLGLSTTGGVILFSWKLKFFRRSAHFLKSDVRRAIQAATDAGLAVARVEIDPDGRIVIVSGEGMPKETTTPLEAWKARKNARPA
jgi:hypothetical protein